MRSCFGEDLDALVGIQRRAPVKSDRSGSRRKTQFWLSIARGIVHVSISSPNYLSRNSGVGACSADSMMKSSGIALGTAAGELRLRISGGVRL